MKTETHKCDAAFPPSGLRTGMTKREYLIFQIYKEAITQGINKYDMLPSDIMEVIAKESIQAADILFDELNKS